MKPENLLLQHLPADVYERIEPDLELVTLEHGVVLHRPGDPIRDLYFPTTSMISVTVTMSDGRTVEAGAVGRREVVGINAFMGGFETTQTEYIAQLPGEAYKIAAAPLRAEFDNNAEMRAVMLKYTQAFIAHISQNAACNRLHDLDQRAARWLLEVRDRMRSDRFDLTHEFIAQMVGVSRPSISILATRMKDEGTINYSRGHFEVLDVDALKEQSCECYGVLKEEYERLLGPKPRSKMKQAVMEGTAGTTPLV